MFQEELLRIREWRKNRGVNEGGDADRIDLVGVAFSGGGIRSATFNLGVLQALAKHKVLHCVDYLSTVSGGGYIGSWLNALIYRDGMAGTESALDPDNATPAARGSLARIAVAHLRAYSNYLTPKVSLMSADTWTLWTIWSRNTLLLLTTLVTGIASLILMGLMVGVEADPFADIMWKWLPWPFFLVAAILLGLNISEKLPKRYRDDQWVQLLVILPAFAGSILLTVVTYKGLIDNIWLAGAILTLLYLVFQKLAGFWNCFHLQHDNLPAICNVLLQVLAAAAAGFLTSTLLYGLSHGLDAFDHSHVAPITTWVVLVVGPPAVVGAVAFGTIANVGMMGRDIPDSTREWLGRLGAWACVYNLVWLAFFGIAVFGPLVLHVAWNAAAAWVRTTVTAAWIATTIGSLMAGKSPKTGDQEKAQSSGGVMNAVAVVGPYIFMVGFIMLISWGIHGLVRQPLRRAPTNPPTVASNPTPVQPAATPVVTESGCTVTVSVGPGCQKAEAKPSPLWEDYWKEMDAEKIWTPGDQWSQGLLDLFLLSVAGCLLTAWRVDINEFSLHHFYKNRLVRCYLGASRRPRERHPNPFTNFDPQDDFPLSHLDDPKFSGLFPIVNATLNLSAGRNLAWQERKGASYVFTPLYSGYDTGRDDSDTAANRQMRVGVVAEDDDPAEVTGGPAAPAYYPTQFVARMKPDSRYPRFEGTGIALGTTFAVSGAAASPNMGFHTSTAVAFLMTVFNVRLGRWLGNPAKPKKADKSGPVFGLLYTVAELFGTTNADSAFVNLSDGGHFDNMGLYELVRRRCRFIILGDAEQDEELKFGGLATAIRMCRTDFGAEITICLDGFKRSPDNDPSNFSGCNYAIGTIRYQNPTTDPDGILVYLKSSLTGKEPADVLGYHNIVPQFPHESTADQWFDESQFESYRRLGLFVGEAALNSGGVDITVGLERFFDSLKGCPEPPRKDSESAKKDGQPKGGSQA